MQNKYETINLDYPSVEDLIEALKKFPANAQIILDCAHPTGITVSYEKDDREYEGEPVNEEYVNLEYFNPDPYWDY